MNVIDNAIAELNDHMRVMNAMVVARNGRMEWTRGELDALFKRVANAENWKLAIDAVVTIANDLELEGTRQAIAFFTGSYSTFVPLGNNRYRVTARGYYADIGA